MSVKLKPGETWNDYFMKYAICDGRGNMDGLFVPLSVAMIAVETLSPKDEDEQWYRMSHSALLSIFKDENKEEAKSQVEKIKNYLQSIEDFERWLQENISILNNYYNTVIEPYSISYSVEHPTLTSEGIRVEVDGEFHMIPYEVLYDLEGLQQKEADKKSKEEKLRNLQFSRQAKTNELADLDRLVVNFGSFIVMEDVKSRQKALRKDLSEIEATINQLKGLFVGRRVDESGVLGDRKPGDYWSLASGGYMGITPNGIHCNLKGTVTQFHDKTISVGSLISVSQDGKSWCGCLNHGIWEAQ